MTFSAGPVNIRDSGQVVAIIKEHNSKYNQKKVRDGAALVGRMNIGKCWLAQDDIKARTKGGKGVLGQVLGH